MYSRHCEKEVTIERGLHDSGMTSPARFLVVKNEHGCTPTISFQSFIGDHYLS